MRKGDKESWKQGKWDNEGVIFYEMKLVPERQRQEKTATLQERW